MADLMQQAREAARRARLVHDERQQEVVSIPVQDWATIVTALRAAPEVTDEMVEAAHAAYWTHPDDSGEDRPCIRAALEAALAARPQGVNNG